MTLDLLIAWHPAVALAVADWLDETARRLPARDPVRERREHEERLRAGWITEEDDE